MFTHLGRKATPLPPLATPSPQLQRIEDTLDNLNRRMTRIETRLVLLMASSHLDCNGKPVREPT